MTLLWSLASRPTDWQTPFSSPTYSTGEASLTLATMLNAQELPQTTVVRWIAGITP